MHQTLHVTNGDHAVEALEQAGITGSFLPWRDVLYEGPVPGGISDEILSNLRARYIADQGWGDYTEVRNAFLERDSTLRKHNDYEKLVLWFEPDLYDQLQLLEILNRLNSEESLERIELILSTGYLGESNAEFLKGLYRHRAPLTREAITLAVEAWKAFRAASPAELTTLLDRDTNALPFLRPAIIRLLEEYPHVKSVLSRTQTQAMKLIEENEGITLGDTFTRSQMLEEHKYLGDTTFARHISDLADVEHPLVKFRSRNPSWPSVWNEEIELTEIGTQVLSGQQDHVALNGIDRWIGGTHLKGKTIEWRWNPATHRIERF